jgi:hypothetical protein
MEHPADIYALAKQALRILVRRQPVFFIRSESLLDDLRTAYKLRDRIPGTYEALLREARDSVMEFLAVYVGCRTLQLAAIRADPEHLWDWPATASDSPRHHHRLATFLLPLVLREVIRAVAPWPENVGHRS